MKTTVSFLLAFFLFVSFAFSQLVSPNNRVHTRLNVRDMPSSAGQIIGSLAPGEAAPLITDTVSHYYQILFEGSDQAYVHKGYSELVGHVKDSLVIGSWNIKFFGSSNSGKRDIKAIADIVQFMDVMAIQELKDHHFIKHLDSLVAELGRRGYRYDYIYSDSSGYMDNPDTNLNNYAERGGFIWDVDRIEFLGSGDKCRFITSPVINNPIFRIVPVVAEFKVLSGSGFDFQLVSLHTVYKKEISWVRKQEFEYIHQWMNEQANDTTLAEKDIFIMGDFNANPPGQPKAHQYFNDIITDTTAYRIIFNEPLKAGEQSIRTTVMIPVRNVPHANELPAYDHLLLLKNTGYAVGMDTVTWASGIIGVIEFDTIPKWRAFTSALSVGARISDHRPIWIKLDYNTEDKD
ncbi:MAG: endonuclease/exonuclease/phosphatase family protein [Bacteroidetes bacterium]|nr:endonuclease/exonuclease/phosphatase family protein [Bacteroidota bacterium]